MWAAFARAERAREQAEESLPLWLRAAARRHGRRSGEASLMSLLATPGPPRSSRSRSPHRGRVGALAGALGRLGPLGSVPVSSVESAHSCVGDEDEDDASSHEGEASVASMQADAVRRLRRSVSNEDPVPEPEDDERCPGRWFSSEWWARALRLAVAARMAHTVGHCRPLRLHGGCSGVGSEYVAAECVGIPMQKEAGVACERRESARKMLLANAHPYLQHCFGTLRDTYHGSGGYCHVHGGFCSAPYAAGNGTSPDIYVTGPPCQPFSTQRPNYQRTGCLGHPEAYTIFGGAAPCQRPRRKGLDYGNVLDAVRAAKPTVFIYENVLAFAKEDPVWKKTPVVEFVAQLKEIQDSNGDPVYTHFQIFEMSPHQFVSNIQRDRIYLVASGPAFGGAKAVDEMNEVMKESQQTRTLQEAMQARGFQEGGCVMSNQQGCVRRRSTPIWRCTRRKRSKSSSRRRSCRGRSMRDNSNNWCPFGGFFVVPVFTWTMVS